MNAHPLRSPLARLALLVALGFFVGCASGPVIKYEADRSVDVSGYKTFFQIPFSKTKGVSGPSADPGAALKLADPINRSIKNTLVLKGYTAAPDAASADFAVNVRASLVPQTDVTDWGMGYAGYPGWRGRGGYGYWGGGGGGYNVSVDQYNQGVLRIEIFDAKKKELVWVGWASDRVDKMPEESVLAKVISDILANFPAPPEAAK